MEEDTIVINPKSDRSSKKEIVSSNLYTNSLLSRRILLDISKINRDLDKHILEELENNLESKCIREGYIRSSSIKLISKSGGLLEKSSVLFDVVFSCDLCIPCEGMVLDCVVKNVTKAGIRAETREEPTPIVVFISRDHNYTSKYFGSIKENQSIKIKVIGFRFELNDDYISVIADLIDPIKRKIK